MKRIAFLRWISVDGCLEGEVAKPATGCRRGDTSSHYVGRLRVFLSVHGYGWLTGFALIAALSLLQTAPALTQSDSYEYCYAGACYPKQVSAENAMRAASIYGSRLKKKKGTIGNASELKKWTIEYTVDDIVPPM